MARSPLRSAAPPTSRRAPYSASTARGALPAALHPRHSLRPSRKLLHTLRCCGPSKLRSAIPTPATNASTHTPARTTPAASLPSPSSAPPPLPHVLPLDRAPRAGHNLVPLGTPPRTGPPSGER